VRIAEKLAADSSLNQFGKAQIFACLGDKDRLSKPWIAPPRLDLSGWVGCSDFMDTPCFVATRG
jgi:hypothetical protein